MSRASEQELGRISAWAELLGYCANIWLNTLKVKGRSNWARVRQHGVGSAV